MNIGKTTSYAIKVLSYMALNKNDIHSASSLYNGLKFPHQYLRQILTSLSKKGYIKSSKGRKGGFVFAKDTKKIFIADIILSFEGDDIFERCIIGYNNCIFENKCAMHDTWVSSRNKILKELKSTSLDKLLKKK